MFGQICSALEGVCWGMRDITACFCAWPLPQLSLYQETQGTMCSFLRKDALICSASSEGMRSQRELTENNSFSSQLGSPSLTPARRFSRSVQNHLLDLAKPLKKVLFLGAQDWDKLASVAAYVTLFERLWGHHLSVYQVMGYRGNNGHQHQWGLERPSATEQLENVYTIERQLSPTYLVLLSLPSISFLF